MHNYVVVRKKQSSLFAPVCYCGNFATKATQIYQYSDNNIWKTIEDSLSIGDSIQEGHFAERAWAHLLSHPHYQRKKLIY